MKAWMFALLAGRRPQLVSQTFAANGVLVVPASVNAVDMTGFGARGVNGSSYPSRNVSMIVVDVDVANIVGNGPSTPLTWEQLAGTVESIANQVRASGFGSSNSAVGYTGYLGDNTAYFRTFTVNWQGASGVSTSYPLWGSGPIRSRGFGAVNYTQPGGTNPPTTGTAATGAGKTFPGSTGNVAQTPVTFTNVAVTPGASYNIVVPTGGSVTISYYV